VKGIHGLQSAAQLKYRLAGKLRVAGDNMTSGSLPFESEGQVKLNDLKAMGNKK